MSAWSEIKVPDTPSFLAMVLVLSIVGLVFVLAAMGHSDTDTFKILVGGLMSVGFTNIVGYYFGSSSGSKAKDEVITALTGQDIKREDIQTAKDAAAAGPQ